MSLINPHTLPEDRERVVTAHQACYAEKARIYKQHAQVAKLAYLQGDKELHEASEAWQEAADLKVSTEFDLIHFEAQIRLAKTQGRQISPLLAQLIKLRGRHRDAVEAFPEKQERIRALYEKAKQRYTPPTGTFDI